MKKIIALTIVLCFVFIFGSCEVNFAFTINADNTKDNTTESQGNQNKTHRLYGIVLEVQNGCILVETNSENGSLAAGQYLISLPNDISHEYFMVGDNVDIEFRYPIAETYPAQIQDVINISIFRPER